MPFDGVGLQESQSHRPAVSSGNGWLAAVYEALGPTIRARLMPEARPAAVTTEEIVMLLRTARALAEPSHRWVRGHYHRFPGRYCGVGALREAARTVGRRAIVPAHELLLDVAHKHGFETVERMNDHSSHDFMLAAFDTAIANAPG